jgi:hypothetical protein
MDALSTSNHNKRPRDAQQAGEFAGATDVGEGRDWENKRCRMEGEPVAESPSFSPTDNHQTPAPFASPVDASQLSTPIGQLSDTLRTHPTISLDDVIASALTNPEQSGSALQLGPISVDQGPNLSLSNSTNAELQDQLVQTWDPKRVTELEQQG